MINVTMEQGKITASGHAGYAPNFSHKKAAFSGGSILQKSALFQEFDQFQCGADIAVHLQLAKGKRLYRIQFAVDQFDQIIRACNQDGITVIILIRLNMDLSVFDFHIKDALRKN